MKKIFLALAAMLCVATVSAQSNKWTIGGRVGSGLQAQVEYELSDKNNIELRVGMGWLSNKNVYCEWSDTYYWYREYIPVVGINFELQGLYNWHVLEFDWTPKAGTWFLDAGVGAGFGIRKHYAYVGVAGQAKFGFTFKKIPLKLAVDWTPIIGPDFAYGKFKGWDVCFHNGKKVGFAGSAMGNFGISAAYCF